MIVQITRRYEGVEDGAKPIGIGLIGQRSANELFLLARARTSVQQMVADLEIKRNDQIASEDDYDVKAAELKRKIQTTHIGEDIKEFVQQQHRTLKDAIDDDRRVYEDSCTKSVASLNQAYADGVAIVQEMNKQFTAGISERNAAAQAEIAATHKNVHAKIVTKLDIA